MNKDIMVLFGLEKLSPEKGAQMVERLGRLVFQSVLVRVLPLLSSEDLALYEKMTEGDEEIEAILKFLAEKVPDFEKVIEEEAEILRNELTTTELTF